MCVLIRKEICVDVLNCSIKFILLATNYVTVCFSSLSLRN